VGVATEPGCGADAVAGPRWTCRPVAQGLPGLAGSARWHQHSAELAAPALLWVALYVDLVEDADQHDLPPQQAGF
jgi:hypothetical protein